MSSLASKFKACQGPRSRFLKHKGSLIIQKPAYKLLNKSNSGLLASNRKKNSKNVAKKVNVSLKSNSSTKIIRPRKTNTESMICISNKLAQYEYYKS
mmetsp:Transcript_17877/g.15787  ORF Transcript_17877/g.15787 Transcript_17877/m.15787 type:complete len:97 (-) Transcript_17877:45-335(-)